MTARILPPTDPNETRPWTGGEFPWVAARVLAEQAAAVES